MNKTLLYLILVLLFCAAILLTKYAFSDKWFFVPGSIFWVSIVLLLRDTVKKKDNS